MHVFAYLAPHFKHHSTNKFLEQIPQFSAPLNQCSDDKLSLLWKKHSAGVAKVPRVALPQIPHVAVLHANTAAVQRLCPMSGVQFGCVIGVVARTASASTDMQVVKTVNDDPGSKRTKKEFNEVCLDRFCLFDMQCLCLNEATNKWRFSFELNSGVQHPC